ncbi:MAG: DMT family transporter [Steroidobacteraceae bacterium]
MQGVVYALTAAVLFGASTPLAKWLLGNGLDSWLLAGLLYGGAGIGLSIVYLLRGHHLAEASVQRRDLPWLAPVVLFGGIAGPVLLMYGLAHTSASSASLLLNLEGLATLTIAWLVFHEHVDRRLLLGALAILCGATLLSYRGADSFGIGTLAIAAACLAWGIDNNLTRKLSGRDPLQIAAIKGIVAGCVNITLAMTQGAHWPGGLLALEAGVIGFFGYGISVVAFVLAMRHLGTARTGAYFSTAPFIGTALSVILLNDSVSVSLLIAAGLMGIGVYLHLTENHEHEHAHESLEHEHRHVHDAHHQHLHDTDVLPDEPHSHQHQHVPLIHRHRHYPDIHHRHGHPH